MSKSIHQTAMSVFGKKSINEINDMINNDDPDVIALRQKFEIKKQIRNEREMK